MILNIAKDYSMYTGLRYCNISEMSGEDFYHTMLNSYFKKALEKGEKLEIILDDVEDDGYSPSFIDESFGNLVYDFTAEIVINNLILHSEKDPHIVHQILEMTIPRWERRRLQGDKPKKTARHKPWFRFIEGNFVPKVWVNVSDK